MSMPLHPAQFAEQLPMFMTAGEIRAKHRLWNADRQIVGEGGKSEREAWDEHFAEKGYRPVAGFQGGNPEVLKRMGPRHPENDTEMMDRKYREAQVSAPGVPSMAEHIREHGAIDQVIPLKPTTYGFAGDGPTGVDSEKVSDHLGNQFTPWVHGEMLGGHHRVAVHEREAPNTLLPVMFHTSMHDARSSGYYA